MLPILALLLAALTWGSAFCFIKQILDQFSPYYLLAFRFSLAGMILCLLFFRRLLHTKKETIKRGIKLGIILYFEFFFYTIGLQYTSASKSAFICAGYMIILPLVYYMIAKKRPTRYEVLASIVCMAGLTCILCSDISSLNIGDAISCLTTVCYAVHIVYTGIYAKKDDPILLNVLQISVAGILAWGFALFTDPIPSQIPSQIPSDVLSGIVFLSVMCTIIPYFLSVYGQRYVSTSTSGILLSFESVFGAGLSILILGDPITPMFIVGTVLVTGAAGLSEIRKS